MAVWKSGPHASALSPDARYLNVSNPTLRRSATRSENPTFDLLFWGDSCIRPARSPSINVPGIENVRCLASPIPSILAAIDNIDREPSLARGA